MKYVSIDIETTCLVPRKPENILGISLVVEDTENLVPLLQLPHFTCIVRHDRIEGSAGALAMNKWLLDELVNDEKGIETLYPVLNAKTESGTYRMSQSGMYPTDTWVGEAHRFLDEYFGTEKINLAGKNAGVFDFQFLPANLQARFRHRIIDVGSVCVDWSKKYLLDLSSLKKQAGLEASVSHNMYEDALDNIAVLRTTYKR